ncbi:origin recognition complex subunit 1 [Lampris incognitus]|uniref:origin recognition complex subunit 1 n=1 Tax=Lampris incognitus TaxID=2546036 RepID=UPI0024B5BEAD|nr:origin recognition complex subunit 1 [Lampris incognitus]
MVRYSSRLRVRRIYKWVGTPTSFNSKLNTYEYKSLKISTDGLPKTTMITVGQHILIEGDDDDNPLVAKVIKLFGDEIGQRKKAVIQWFVQRSEVPPNKLKLLGRALHPQEIFYYEGRSCNDEINVDSIISTVQVKHLPEVAPFPKCDSKDTLYVKLSWDTKTFKALDLSKMEGSADPAHTSPPPHSKPALPPSTPCSPHAVAPTSNVSSRRALPTPDLAVMRRATSVAHCHGTNSAGKMTITEVESMHTASKLSASKCLNVKRRVNTTKTPNACKKLELGSPKKKMTREDVLSMLLDEDRESMAMQGQRLFSSRSKTLSQSFSLTPLKTVRRSAATLKSPSLSPTEQESIGITTPSRRRDSPKAIKEPSLGALPEMANETSPMLPAAMTPRSSKRKSAKLVSSHIRAQLNLLGNHRDLSSDSEDGNDFIPSKKDLHSCSEDEEDVDSDDEVVVKRRKRGAAGSRIPRATKKTRSSTRTPLKTPSKKVTPSTTRTPRHATPSIPNRSLPARQPGNVLEEARARLHVSAVPESLPCREQEFQDIYNFVESKIIDGTGGCMYISGVPGTGKTATVHEVMRSLQHAADIDEIPSFHFIEINGMKMTDPHQAYVQILQKLTGQKATADHAAALLERKFSNPAPKKMTTVLLVDELDLLWTRKQNVMYNLFDWPTRRQARLVVLTIANTMDLPERIMINRVASRLGLTRMSFQPYTFKQLQQIIMSRLNKVKAFEEDALQLVSRKVAALSGDARRCLDICRRATEICEHSASSRTNTGLVGMSHVMQALDEMFSSAYITAIRCASVHEQLFLRAVIAEFRRLGLEEATFQQVFVQHQALCRVEGLKPISVSEGLAVCQRLGGCRLLLLEPSHLGILQRVRLNVSQDDVLYALKAD